MALGTDRPGIQHDHLQQKILEGLREMIAVARCDKQAIFVSRLAAHAIHKFAVMLETDLDRCRVIEFLEEVNAMGCWPTRDSVDWLRAQWLRRRWYAYVRNV